MAGVEAGVSAALAYARDDSHGYELRERDYGVGTDCAGLARLYAAAVEGVSLSSYPEMHTWDMRSVLTKRGWQAVSFSESAMRRGDLLVREDPSGGTGHTVVYLGNRRIVGAEGDWDGRRGDSSGREVTERSYYSYGYKWILRPPAAAEIEDDMTSDQAKQLKAIYDWIEGYAGDQLTRTDTAGHDNPSGHNVFGRLQIIEHNISVIMARLGLHDRYRDYVGGVGSDANCPQLDDEIAQMADSEPIEQLTEAVSELAQAVAAM